MDHTLTQILSDLLAKDAELRRLREEAAHLHGVVATLQVQKEHAHAGDPDSLSE